MIAYAHPAGSDASPGTVSSPVCSVDAALAALGTNSGEVRLAPGSYDTIHDSRRRNGAQVTIIGQGSKVAGYESTGATDIILKGLDFTGRVNCDYAGGTSVADRIQRPTERLALLRCRVRGGVRILNAATNISVLHSWLHGGQFGVQGPGRPVLGQQSRKIRILDSVFYGMTEDAIQFGCWDDVEIARNTLEGTPANLTDPDVHPDGIQITGRANRVKILDNAIRGSRTQSLMIQSMLGAVDDVLVQGNHLGNTYGVAMQVLGADRVRVLDNEILGSKDGALFVDVGGGEMAGHVPAGTQVERNVLHSLTGLPYRVGTGIPVLTRSGSENVTFTGA